MPRFRYGVYGGAGSPYEDDPSMSTLFSQGVKTQDEIAAARQKAQTEDAAERLRQLLMGQREAAQAGARAAEAAQESARAGARELALAQERERLRVASENELDQQRTERELPGINALLSGSPDLARRVGAFRAAPAGPEDETGLTLEQYQGIRPVLHDLLKQEATTKSQMAQAEAVERRAAAKADADFRTKYGISPEEHAKQRSERLARLTSELNDELSSESGDPQRAAELQHDIVLIQNGSPHDIAQYEQRLKVRSLVAKQREALEAQKAKARMDQITTQAKAQEAMRVRLANIMTQPRQEAVRVQQLSSLAVTMNDELRSVTTRLRDVATEIENFTPVKVKGQETPESVARRTSLRTQHQELTKQHGRLLQDLDRVADAQTRAASNGPSPAPPPPPTGTTPRSTNPPPAPGSALHDVLNPAPRIYTKGTPVIGPKGERMQLKRDAPMPPGWREGL